MTLKDEELKGKRFGMLTVLHRDGKDKWGDPIFRFRCDCGVEKSIRYGDVRKGSTISCGCYNKTKNIGTPSPARTHGLSQTHIYNLYYGIKRRCYDDKDKDYHNYGARGIKMCDTWLGENGFETFVGDMGRRPSTEYSIERLNVNGDYCPENCIWLDKKLQARNRRNNRFITFKGETKTVADWSEIVNIKQSTICKRLDLYGYTIEEALTLKSHDKRKKNV